MKRIFLVSLVMALFGINNCLSLEISNLEGSLAIDPRLWCECRLAEGPVKLDSGRIVSKVEDLVPIAERAVSKYRYVIENGRIKSYENNELKSDFALSIETLNKRTLIRIRDDKTDDVGYYLLPRIEADTIKAKDVKTGKWMPMFALRRIPEGK